MTDNKNVDQTIHMSAAFINIINNTVILLFIKMSALKKKKKHFEKELTVSLA